ncbi:MAG: DHH family phosphoesterase [Desulfobacteraceae bacterium]
MISNTERLRRFNKRFAQNSNVLVVINADPDAIASALAVKRLLWRKVNRLEITYFNEITRPDNLAMIHLVEPKMVPLKDIDPDRFNRFVVVDSQPDHNEAFSRFSYDVIIDHHPVTSDNADYSDIRPDYGACSTIMVDYLKAARINPSRRLAAALLLGIKTDTADFTRQAGLQDVKAFQYLYKYASINLVTKVERAVVTESDLDYIARAIKNRMVKKSRLFSHAGRVENSDEIVIAADFFLGVAGVNWSIVSGIFHNKLVVVLRNDGLRKSAGKAAAEAFAKYGSAGGHKTMARAEIPMPVVEKHAGARSRDAVASWIVQRVEKKAGKKTD